MRHATSVAPKPEDLITDVGELKKRITELENENRLHQYAQLKADVRDYDKIIWGSPIVSAAITGVILTAGFSSTVQLPNELKALTAFVGAFLNLALLVGLYKHRFFQEYKNGLVNGLEKQLGLVTEEKPTKGVYESMTNKRRGWVYRRRAYNWLLAAQIILTSAPIGIGMYVLFPNVGLAAVSLVVSLALTMIMGMDPA